MRKILILFVSLFLCCSFINNASAAKRDPFLGAMDDDSGPPRPPKLILLPPEGPQELLISGCKKIALGGLMLYASWGDTCTPESLWCTANFLLELTSFLPLVSGMKDLLQVYQYQPPIIS